MPFLFTVWMLCGRESTETGVCILNQPVLQLLLGVVVVVFVVVVVVGCWVLKKLFMQAGDD